MPSMMKNQCADLLLRSLVANIIAGEVVAPLRRTAVFGMFQGSTMLGQGIGYLSTSSINRFRSSMH